MTVTFYATTDADSIRDYMPAAPVMLPIASWWRRNVNLDRPPTLPAHVGPIAVDTGSFSLAQKFSDGYPFGFTPASIVSWCRHVQPEWVALPDWPMEGRDLEDRARLQRRTTDTAWLMASTYPDEAWAWSPVIQGWTVDESLRHAIEMADLCYSLREHYARRGTPGFRVSIGSICRRDAVGDIRDVVEALAAVLPDLPLHLFGVKLDLMLGALALPGAVISLDSAAWNGRFGHDLEQYRDQPFNQREYAWRVAYPAYVRRLATNLARPKQGALL